MPLNRLPWFLGSVITSNGNLTPNFEYIADLRAANESKNNVIPGDFTSEKKVSLMPSPSAFSKIFLSVLKFLGILKFLRHTQNILGILK